MNILLKDQRLFNQLCMLRLSLQSSTIPHSSGQLRLLCFKTHVSSRSRIISNEIIQFILFTKFQP